ncbi:alcohol dehydrogenase [Orenia metallireducens]|uniref:iron-containing alcohol dehydrogenase family protein n=1 Tax=Orenia metallireducens TaxID=1413210 RepID=UPI000D057829|nr:iron-containing alcohol dehydrogenase [Orenia metallireducens]PRX27420.1 alcohol dehydrogenase [Orenia metallireducens]
MFDFEYYSPTKVAFGPGKLGEIGQLIGEYGNKALVVTDSNIEKVGILAMLEEYLDEAEIDYDVFAEVEEDPSAELVERGAKFAEDNDSEFIIGVGGGSSIDAAKAIAVARTHPAKIRDYLVGAKIGAEGITSDVLPIVTIPTTSGTGSEVTPVAVISDKEEESKRVLFSPYLFPQVAIVDPELTFTLPKEMTVYTAIDALCQAMEAYLSPEGNIISDLLSLESIELIRAAIYDAVNDEGNLQARTKLALGATLSGMVISQAGVGAAHALAMVLGGRYKLPHGLGIAMVLPYVVEYNAKDFQEAYLDIAEAFGIKVNELTEQEAITALVEDLKELNQRLGVKAKLRDFGVAEDLLLELGQAACDHEDMRNNPKEPTAEEMRMILEKVF